MLDSLSTLDTTFLRNLNDISSRMQRAQGEMSSGLKVQKPSDAPDEIGLMLQLRASLDRNSQVRTNLGRVKAEVDGAESSLQTAASVLDSVRSLGTQGATDFSTPATRQNLAGQVDALLQNLVGLAQTQVDGRFVFSGDSDGTAPYTYDASQSPPVSTYAGSGSTRQIAMPNGSKVPLALTAQQIFDSPVPESNVFAAVTALRDSLQSNDAAGITDAITQLGSASTYLNQQLAFYGTAQNQVAQGLSDADTQEVQMKAELSGIEDADVASAILDLQSATTQQSAALSARAQIPRTTLFDYLR
jgi:flagellar hook-associated protein 3 FlgL